MGGETEAIKNFEFKDVLGWFTSDNARKLPK
jgi:hypothetical protein